MTDTNYQKYLPLGTVVLLKGATKRLMITGFCIVDSVDSSVIHDYSACIYPEGMLKPNQLALFNHEQIAQIIYMGYRDQEEIDFKKKLNDLLVSRNAFINNNNNMKNVPQNNNVTSSI